MGVSCTFLHLFLPLLSSSSSSFCCASEGATLFPLLGTYGDLGGQVEVRAGWPFLAGTGWVWCCILPGCRAFSLPPFVWRSLRFWGGGEGRGFSWGGELIIQSGLSIFSYRFRIISTLLGVSYEPVFSLFKLGKYCFLKVNLFSLLSTFQKLLQLLLKYVPHVFFILL